MRAYIWARTGEELRLLTIKVGMVYVKYKRDETTYCTTGTPTGDSKVIQRQGIVIDNRLIFHDCWRKYINFRYSL